MMIPVSLSPEMNSPVIQDDITSCTASDSDSSESDDEKTAATKVCKDTDVPVAKKAKSDAVKPVGRTRAAATSRMKGNAKAKTRPPAPASAGVKAQKIQKGSKSQRETQRAVASHCTDQAVQAVSQCQPPTDGTSDDYGRKKPKTDTALQEKHNHPMQTHSQDQQKILPEPVSDPVSFQPPLHNSDEVHVLSDEGNRQAPLPSRWDVRTRRVSSRESACSGTPAPGTPRFGEPAPVSPQLVTPQSHQIHSQCPAVTLPQAGPESDSQQLTRRWDFTQGEVCSRELGVPVPGTPRHDGPAPGAPHLSTPQRHQIVTRDPYHSGGRRDEPSCGNWQTLRVRGKTHYTDGWKMSMVHGKPYIWSSFDESTYWIK